MVLKDRAVLIDVELPCERAVAADVREALARLEHIGSVTGDAMLVASELVTNVVTHGDWDPGRRIELTVAEGRDALLISVRDPTNARSPAAPAPGPLEPGSGLGLVIVTALARRWGTDHTDGYFAWAELAKP